MLVYKVTNIINERAYVGITTFSFEKRWKEHIKCSVTRNPKQLIHRALKKYGIQSFKREIIDEAEDLDVLYEKERYWINKLGTKIPFGYNMTDGGEGYYGGIMSESTRKRISSSRSGTKHSSITKEKISLSLKGNKNAEGAVHSEESRKNVSLRMKGKQKTEEQKSKIGERSRGRKHTEEAKEKNRIAHLGKIPANKGKKMNPITKKYL